MTIAKQFLSSKKGSNQQEEPLVPNEKKPSVKDVEEGKPVVVTMHPHARRVSSMTTLCVFITALLVCSTGIIGGVYLYRQFSHYKLRHFHGWCSIPYGIEGQDSPKSEPLTGAASQTVQESVETPHIPKKNFIEEKLDIDVKTNQYERIDVPSFAHGRRARFMHDFLMNKTAIADYENRRCFVTNLNRDYVYPPVILYGIISKMRAGFYDADTQVVRQNMRVVLPRITDLSRMGVLIARECSSLTVYVMERSTSPVFKRSLNEDSKKAFVEFAGNKIVEYNILNINDAVSSQTEDRA